MAFIRKYTAILLYGLQYFLRPIISLSQSANAIAAGKLELLVEERTHELRQTHAALVQSKRLATLGKLTATVSHELRNPLGTIQLALFSIEDSIKSKTPHQAERPIELAERSIIRGVNIIEELNNYARVKFLNISETSVDDWLKVVVNLISNAVHALQERLPAKKHLHISTRLLDANYEIRFNDNGIGMTKEVAKKMFEPLFSTKGFGVGLGMIIVKNIVKQHHGAIYIESKEGRTLP